MRLSDIITPEVLDRSMHPGRELNAADIAESQALMEANSSLHGVFAKCHRVHGTVGGGSVQVSDAVVMAVICSLDRAIRMATADAQPPQS